MSRRDLERQLAEATAARKDAEARATRSVAASDAQEIDKALAAAGVADPVCRRAARALLLEAGREDDRVFRDKVGVLRFGCEFFNEPLAVGLRGWLRSAEGRDVVRAFDSTAGATPREPARRDGSGRFAGQGREFTRDEEFIAEAFGVTAPGSETEVRPGYETIATIMGLLPGRPGGFNVGER